MNPLWHRTKRLFLGGPKNIWDRSIFHKLTLIPFLAWVGLGADGLSSTAYGPEEAFKALNGETYLSLGLVVMTVVTVALISTAYIKIIKHFPFGGGGYVVASRTLGEKAGLVSGSALLVDYILTITISIAAAGDAMFSFFPVHWVGYKLAVQIGMLVLLIVLNLRGVRESVVILTPIFIAFLVTHAILIVAGVAGQFDELPHTISTLRVNYQVGLSTLGMSGMALLFLHAYSLGGGTYTGIEAVSNGMAVMREPKAQTAKRTMIYMAFSLAITAGGLLLCYLLWNIQHVPGKTMNALLFERIFSHLPFGGWFVVFAMSTSAALLMVAAQTGFMDGPRVLSSMANDSWIPHRFRTLSDRLTMQNGVLLMGGAAFLALIYTKGSVGTLVVMYSINVFLTFSLSMIGMTRYLAAKEYLLKQKLPDLTLFIVTTVLCVAILIVTIYEKFFVGGWITLFVTGGLICLCYIIRRHYLQVADTLAKTYAHLVDFPRTKSAAPKPIDYNAPTAVILVSSYGGLGVFTVLNVLKTFSGMFKNVVFISVGIVDSEKFKGPEALDALKSQEENILLKYHELAESFGLPCDTRYEIGTDSLFEIERLCVKVAKEYARPTFFAGKIVFEQQRWYHRYLHNDTALTIQQKLLMQGLTMVVLPVKTQ